MAGTIITDFELKNNWAPRVGAAHRPDGRRQDQAVRNFGFSTRIPGNDLAARALSSDNVTSRSDYFDANLTQPIPNGVVAGGVTNHFAIAGVGADTIDPNAKAVGHPRVRGRNRTRDSAAHQPRRALDRPPDAARARGRGELSNGGGRPAGNGLSVCGAVASILANPNSATPINPPSSPSTRRSPACRSPIRSTGRRDRSDAHQAHERQLVDARVVPLVASARELRRLLPRRQRPVGPGILVALRFPDERSDVYVHWRSPVRLSAATSAISATPTGSCRSIVRSRRKIFGNYAFPWGLNLGLGISAARASR